MPVFAGRPAVDATGRSGDRDRRARLSAATAVDPSPECTVAAADRIRFQTGPGLLPSASINRRDRAWGSSARNMAAGVETRAPVRRPPAETPFLVRPPD